MHLKIWSITMQNNNNQPQTLGKVLLDVSYSTVEPHKNDISKGIEVHKSLLAIQQQILNSGGVKRRYNETQRYYYHSIDDLYAVITPLMLQHQLTCIAHTEHCNISQFLNNKNELQFKATAQVRFIITSIIDGSSIETVIHGEANDNGDKAMSKATTIAKKNLYMQIFAIPLGEQNENEDTSRNAKPWGNNQRNQGRNNQQNWNNGQNNQQQRTQGQNNRPQTTATRLASLELKNEIDERLKPYGTRLNVVIKDAGFDMANITDQQLRKLYDDVRVKLKPRT